MALLEDREQLAYLVPELGHLRLRRLRPLPPVFGLLRLRRPAGHAQAGRGKRGDLSLINVRTCCCTGSHRAELLNFLAAGRHFALPK